jgi:hypothetical protein
MNCTDERKAGEDGSDEGGKKSKLQQTRRYETTMHVDEEMVVVGSSDVVSCNVGT